MAHVLRRCSICKRYHASFLVDDPQLGRLLLCKDCWKARFAVPQADTAAPAVPDAEIEHSGAPAIPAKEGGKAPIRL